MGDFEQFYASVGADAGQVVARIGLGPEVIVRFLSDFKKDDSFRNLCDALERGDTKNALFAAHKLKGVSGTLCFERLFKEASCVNNLLRNGDLSAAQKELPLISEEYSLVLEALEKLER